MDAVTLQRAMLCYERLCGEGIYVAVEDDRQGETRFAVDDVAYRMGREMGSEGEMKCRPDFSRVGLTLDELEEHTRRVLECLESGGGKVVECFGARKEMEGDGEMMGMLYVFCPDSLVEQVYDRLYDWYPALWTMHQADGEAICGVEFPYPQREQQEQLTRLVASFGSTPVWWRWQPGLLSSEGIEGGRRV